MKSPLAIWIKRFDYFGPFCSKELANHHIKSDSKSLCAKRIKSVFELMHPQFVVELSFFVMAPHFNFIAALRSGLWGRCKAWMVPDSLLFIVYQHLTSTDAQRYQCKARTVPHSCQDVELKQEEIHPFKHTNKTLPKTQQIKALSVRETKVKGSCSF